MARSVTLHRYRQEIGRGGFARTVTVSTRLEEADLAKLAELSLDRRSPIAALLRDAVAHYLRSGAPRIEEPSK
jgi:Ribbon-helix-helix protein, copG family